MRDDASPKITEQAWQTYREQVYFFILKRVQDHFVAEDITQDVLIRVFTHLDNLNSDKKFLAWLYQIARNAIADYFRRSKNEIEIPPTLATSEDLESQSAYQELAPCLLPLIQQLPEKYQSAILYSEIHGLSQRELSEKIGLSLSAAKSRVQRGRKLLKDLLFHCCSLQINQAGKLWDYQSKSDCHNCSIGSSQACPSHGS